MSEISKITFNLSATGPDLSIVVRLDQEEKWRGVVTDSPQQVEVEFDDDQKQNRLLEIELQGKLPEHTVIDHDGTILQDRVVQIRDIAIDDIALEYLVTNTSKYYHDNNGTSEFKIHRFYGDMGCNGVMQLDFSTPVYLWLLENM